MRRGSWAGSSTGGKPQVTYACFQDEAHVSALLWISAWNKPLRMKCQPVPLKISITTYSFTSLLKTQQIAPAKNQGLFSFGWCMFASSSPETPSDKLIQILILTNSRAAQTGAIFDLKKSVNELRVWLTGWELDNMMTEGLYKHLLFKISSANADTPRQLLSHFSCRWAILMWLLCTFSTTKLSAPFLLKMTELYRMTKLMNYCIFFLSAAHHLGGAISELHVAEPRSHSCGPRAQESQASHWRKANKP